MHKTSCINGCLDQINDIKIRCDFLNQKGCIDIPFIKNED
jgi:hypothetical protein